MIEPKVGDVWFCDWAEGLVAVKTEPVNVGFNTHFLATKELETGEYGVNDVDLFRGCQLIERDGLRGQALWKTLPYEDCPKEWHDMLQQKWGDGYVIECQPAEAFDPAGEWFENECEPDEWEKDIYRITDLKREPEEQPKPLFKLFEIDWDNPHDLLPTIHEGRRIAMVGNRTEDGYRLFGFTDDAHWSEPHLAVKPGQYPHYNYETQPCDHTGNRKYAIGRLEESK